MNPSEEKFRIPLNDITLILPRRFMLRESAIEFFFVNGKSIFFNFSSNSKFMTPSHLDLEARARNMKKGVPDTINSSTDKINFSPKRDVSLQSRKRIFKLLCSLKA